jgi:hypothetical protein
MNSFDGKARATGLDYSHITFRELASGLVQRGELVLLLLCPEMFGGDARPENVVFVPPFAAEAKTRSDEQIWSLAVDGMITEYAVEPTYSGGSLVPTVLTVHAYDPGRFLHIIRIWGGGLNC